MNTNIAQPVIWFEELRREDVPRVGGKNASLGELVRNLRAEGVSVPPGFATAADAYWEFVDANDLRPVIDRAMRAYREHRMPLAQAGQTLRSAFLQGAFPERTASAICEAYRALSRRFGVAATDVAVRSSATAEDLPDASFAGQQETFLNVRGERALLDACRR